MNDSDKDVLESIRKLILAAAAVVGSVFGLFQSVLKDLVPPSASWSTMAYTGLASFVSVLILLAIILVTPRRPTKRDQLLIAAGATVLSFAALYTLMIYQETLNSFTFDDPPAQANGPAPKKQIRGDVLTDLGKKLFENMSVETAVQACGGLKLVRAHQLLWTQQSEIAVEMRMLKHYVIAVALLNAALFTFAIAVYRSGLLSTKATTEKVKIT